MSLVSVLLRFRDVDGGRVLLGAREAVREAGLLDWVRSLAEGLVLDEPTAHLDPGLARR